MPTTKKDKAAKVSQAKAQRKELTVEGLEGGLARLRHAEMHSYNCWSETGSVSDLKAWHGALDLLRKAEDNLISVLERRKELLPAGEVRSALATMVEAAKSSLLDLPGRVAPSLEGLPWPEIKKALDIELREVLRGLSDNP
jgi:hypothetical protein